jgi:hypothetical protein
MSAEENKAVVRRVYTEVMGNNDLSVVPELFADDYVYHSPGSPDVHGPDGFRELREVRAYVFEVPVTRPSGTRQLGNRLVRVPHPPGRSIPQVMAGTARPHPAAFDSLAVKHVRVDSADKFAACRQLNSSLEYELAQGSEGLPVW